MHVPKTDCQVLKSLQQCLHANVINIISFHRFLKNPFSNLEFIVDFATKRLLYFLGLKGNLQGIASVAHPLLAVSPFLLLLISSCFLLRVTSIRWSLFEHIYCRCHVVETRHSDWLRKRKCLVHYHHVVKNGCFDWLFCLLNCKPLKSNNQA